VSSNAAEIGLRSVSKLLTGETQMRGADRSFAQESEASIEQSRDVRSLILGKRRRRGDSVRASPIRQFIANLREAEAETSV